MRRAKLVPWNSVDSDGKPSMTMGPECIWVGEKRYRELVFEEIAAELESQAGKIRVKAKAARRHEENAFQLRDWDAQQQWDYAATAYEADAKQLERRARKLRGAK